MSNKIKLTRKKPLETFNKDRIINQIALSFPAGSIMTLTNEEIDEIADTVLKAGSTWGSVTVDAFETFRIPYVVRFIQRLKLKGLKVHLRCGFSRFNRLKDSSGNIINFSTGSITSKTEAANTAIPIAGQYVINNSLGTIVDSTKNWTINEWKGYQVYCTSVANNKLVFYINSNTNNTLSISSPHDVTETNSFLSQLGVDLIDTSKGYEISYQCANDNAFTNTTRGLYKYCKDIAMAGLAAGADSFSCSNEMISNIQWKIPGSIFETESQYIQEQKNLVQYIKTQVPDYTDGYTVSEIFWQTDNWINSGSIAPLDFLAYTAYEEESNFLPRLKRVSDKFGPEKIQLDEMSCNSHYEKMLKVNKIQDEKDWAKLLNNRMKYCQFLGIRNVFRWELWDFSGTGSSDLENQRGFGYTKKLNNTLKFGNFESWFYNSYSRKIRKEITNFSLGFYHNQRAIEVSNSSSLDLSNLFTISFKVNLAKNESQTFISKGNSYNISVINRKITARVNIDNTLITLTDDTELSESYVVDKWVEIALTYDNSKLRLFVNGKRVKETNAIGNVINDINTLAIAGEVGNTNLPLLGRIQDIEIAKECKYIANYNTTKLAPKSDFSVLTLLTQQPSGDTIFDTSGKNNNALLTGNIEQKGTYYIGIRDSILDQEEKSEFWKNNLWTGYTISGLEFTPDHRGVAGITYPKVIPRNYAEWFHENGVNCVRLAMLIERLCPVPFGKVDKNYSKTISDFLKNCQDYDIKVFLDIHNYGAYNFVATGGFTFSNSFNVLDPRYDIVNNEIQVRNPTNKLITNCFEKLLGGSDANPVNSSGYKFTTTIRILNVRTPQPKTENLWEGIDIYAMHADENNTYRVYWDDTNEPLKLLKTVNGVTTVLDQKNIKVSDNLNVNRIIEIDVNQAILGKIIVKIDGVQQLIGDHDPLLKNGQIGYRCQESIINIVSYQLTIGNDSNSSEASTGIIKFDETKGLSSYNQKFHEYLYQSLHDEFDSYRSLEGYMYNEPHDMIVETTPLNYKTTSTISKFQQYALNKLRNLGSTKWFGWSSDNWAGAQNITVSTTGPIKWGPNFDFPWSDPLNRTFFDLHFYHDYYPNSIFSNSGTWGALQNSGQHRPYTEAEIYTQLNLLISRVTEINKQREITGLDPVPLNISEVGTPINAANNVLPNSDYLGRFEYILKLLQANQVGFMYFAIGPTAGNSTTGLFADMTDSNGELTITDIRHEIFSKYLNKLKTK